MDRLAQQAFLLFALLIFYCLPFVIILATSLYLIWYFPSNKLSHENTIVKIVIAVATEPGTYTNIIHQMIMPTVAAITAASADALAHRGYLKWMFVLPLFTIFICIADALIFNIQDIQNAPKAIVSQLFVSAASNLAVYVMLLVGLRMAEPKGP